MKEPPVRNDDRCLHCGAAIQSKDRPCWLCRQSPSPESISPYSNPYHSSNLYRLSAPSEKFSSIDYVFTALLFALALLAILVGIGISIDDRTLVVPYLIVIGPTFLVTLGRGIWQWNHEGRIQPARLLLTIFATSAATIGVISIFLVAAFLVLFAVCLSQLR